ncbi:hypothetical protein GCM10011584_31690 [Nocardioides phosphati]|uniref:DUF4360 domain-containing protein n=1 Tax=Nocardioides phosphati TaxID=1867775 RepID=A0ABQ2ND02_9ACTN|nr:hypothetical protein [Nocardioides phosphati]GGO93301.1 hypothetical protein GCM10011584_31690 [Nocardioides phosphati]
MTGAGRRWQRVWVLLGVLTVVLALTLWPDSPREAARAAQACGAGDVNRATLTTKGGVTLHPCLSKVTTVMTVPRTQTSSLGCGTLFLQPCYEIKWHITAVSKTANQTLKYADGTTESGLYRLTFQQFQIDKSATLATSGGSGYTTTLVPDTSAKLGNASGQTINTDLWVTADSTINLSFLTFSCNDNVRPDNGLWTLADVFIDVSAGGCGMNLKIRYAVTTSSGANGEITGAYSVNLPNTLLTVS